MSDRYVLITGCNRGIGKAVLELFAQNGFSIVACTRTKTEELLSWYLSLEQQFNIKIYPLFFDLSDDESIKNAMRELYTLKIPIDILVNNAGIADFRFLSMTKLSDVKNIFQVNYFAPVLITQYVIKLMSRARYGSIINLASIAGLDSTVGNSAYGASKAAMILFTKTLSQEVGVYNIRVNAVAPGFIDTDMQANIHSDVATKIVEQSAIKKFGTTKDVAKTILFLASDDASYITGQVIRIDGGI